MNSEYERYGRQTMLAEMGIEGQRRLQASTVLIVGVGGLGSAATIYLAGAGVGRLILADPDVVSLTNLQRQVLYSEAQIGLPKTVCAAERLRSLNSLVTVDIEPSGLTEENADALVGQADIVVDCTDNYATRYLIDDACARVGRPWIYGSIGEFAGQLSVMNHTRRRRYIELYPDREALCAMPRRVAGVLGAVPGVIGALEACEAIKLLTGMGELHESRLFTIDLLTLNTFTIDF